MSSKTERTYRGLPLTIDQVVGRYLRQVEWGQGCADYLRNQGFEMWCHMFREAHQRYRDEGGFNEWDSWDYTHSEMRSIYDGIIENAERGTIPDEPDRIHEPAASKKPMQAEPNSQTAQPKRRLKLDPDLADGHHWTIHDKPDATLMELIKLWMSESELGASVTITLVEMTDAEVKALPDI